VWGPVAELPPCPLPSGRVLVDVIVNGNQLKIEHA
jgi:hypothetical protein